MEEIERIRDLDDEVFNEFKLYFPKTVTSAFKAEYPSTAYLVGMFDTSATFIKNSIFDSCESDDYYGAKILFRSLIEHFVRFKYVFINWGMTKSDDFAKNYSEYGNAREALDLIKAKVTEQQLIDPDYRVKDWELFLKDHPSFLNKTLKEVDSETQNYRFKNIVLFLNREFNKGKYEMSSFLGKLIVEYSSLSSFVHGGMKSYQEITSVSCDKIRQGEYYRLCSLTFQMSSSIKLLTLLMYVQSDRQSFTDHYLMLDQIIKQIHDQ